MNPRRNPKTDSTTLPLATGYETVASTLCLGLDIAWHGGSKNDRSSQFDFVVATVLGPARTTADVECVRVRLTNRDPDAVLTIAAIQKLIRSYEGKVGRVVLAIDAPIQADPSAPAPLKKRAFRQCERHSIDAARASTKRRVVRAAGTRTSRREFRWLRGSIASLLRSAKRVRWCRGHGIKQKLCGSSSSAFPPRRSGRSNVWISFPSASPHRS